MKSIQLAHQLVSDQLGGGEVVIDATAGNGHDTLFLAQQVGASGTVYSFDVQEEAIRITGSRLEEAKLELAWDMERVSLSRSKMESRFLHGLAVESIKLHGLANGLSVRSFRTVELAGWQREAMEHVHALINKEQAARNRQQKAGGADGPAVDRDSGDEEAGEQMVDSTMATEGMRGDKVTKAQDRLLKRDEAGL